MVTMLIIKNFMVSGRKIFLMILAYSLLAGNFLIRYYPWNVFMMVGYFLFATAASYFSFIDKKNSAEILTLSLPVTREQIVAAKYITSLITFIIGLSLWYLTAYIFDNLYSDASMSFDQITYVKVLFMALLFFSIQQSIFLPSFFGLSYLWMIIVFVISIVLSVIPIPTFFAAYKKSYNPYFTIDDFGLIFFLSLVIILFPLVSFIVSNAVYKKADL